MHASFFIPLYPPGGVANTYSSVLRRLTEATIRWGFNPPASSLESANQHVIGEARTTTTSNTADGIWIRGDTGVDKTEETESDTEQYNAEESEKELEDGEDQSEEDVGVEDEDSEEKKVVLTGGRFGALSLDD
jgi:hypothetical protein